jgi:hypothetical protein
MDEAEKLIPPHGGYRKLKGFRLGQLEEGGFTERLYRVRRERRNRG